MTVSAILDQVARYGAHHVCVTGGEPLAQKRVHGLLKQLCDGGYEVSLETSGALDVSEVDPRVIKVMDIKTPGSGEAERNLDQNFSHLSAQDQIKYVIGDEADFNWSVEHFKQHQLAQQCEILFSPVAGQLKPDLLADWILRDRLPVRFQLQLHKVLWGDTPGR